MGKNVCVLNTGCPISRIESAKVMDFFKENEWNVIDDFKKADLIIFRACALIEKNEKTSLDIIKKINSEKREDTKLFVWGCLHKINPDVLSKIYDGITFDETQLDILNELINANKEIQNINSNFLVENYDLPPDNFYNKYIIRIPNLFLSRIQKRLSIARTDIPIFHIKAATGCIGNCTFCAVKQSRGYVKSKSIDDIFYEFIEGLSEGYKYFSLLATDLGAYGRDQGHSLVDLLNKMTSVPGDYRIALRNMCPNLFIDMFEDFKPFFSSGKIWFLSSSVESGSDRIIQLMGRRYNIEEFSKCIDTINVEYPDIFVKTQIIVGFPTETKADFQKSMQLLSNLNFDWVEIYKYSKRPGTISSSMEGQVPEYVKNVRYFRMLMKVSFQYFKKKLKSKFTIGKNNVKLFF